MPSNPAPIMPPPPIQAVQNAGDLVTVYFRQTADGVNFTLTPVFMAAADAVQAVANSPQEYSISGNFPAWTRPYNSTAPIGGRGRLLGAHNQAQ